MNVVEIWYKLIHITSHSEATAVRTKMTVFWDVAPRSLAEIDGRFRGAYCLRHQGDEHPRRQSFSRLGFLATAPCFAGNLVSFCLSSTGRRKVW
jgi:hypothetical protein